MPIYEYACSECGRDFEILVMNPEEKVVCPQCGSEDAKRKLSCFSTQGGNDLGPLPSPSGGCGSHGGFS